MLELGKLCDRVHVAAELHTNDNKVSIVLFRKKERSQTFLFFFVKLKDHIACPTSTLTTLALECLQLESGRSAVFWLRAQ